MSKVYQWSFYYSYMGLCKVTTAAENVEEARENILTHAANSKVWYAPEFITTLLDAVSNGNPDEIATVLFTYEGPVD